MNKDQIKAFFTKVSEKQNYFAIISAIIGLIGMFLPYATVSFWGFSNSINYISTDDGKIYLVLLIAATVFYFLKREGIGCIISVFMACVALYDFSDFTNVSNETYGLAQQNSGSYIVLLAAILMVATPFIGAKVEAFIKNNLNSKTNS